MVSVGHRTQRDRPRVHALLETSDGDRMAEVHWVQCGEIGKFEFFVKEWLD